MTAHNRARRAALSRHSHRHTSHYPRGMAAKRRDWHQLVCQASFSSPPFVCVWQTSEYFPSPGGLRGVRIAPSPPSLPLHGVKVDGSQFCLCRRNKQCPGLGFTEDWPLSQQRAISLGCEKRREECIRTVQFLIRNQMGGQSLSNGH